MAKSKKSPVKKIVKKAAIIKKMTDAKPNSLSNKITAKDFIQKLKSFQSDTELEKIKRYFKTGKGEYSEGVKFIGVQMGKIFALAKENMAMELNEVEKLLDHPVHEVRVGAVSIMDFQARDKRSTDERKKELYELYIRRHDRINNWDLVDRSAPYVIGGYLFDKSRTILDKLAKSKYIWERRTAIVSTYFFIRQGQVKDTFRIAKLLINDKEEIIQKATGSWVRAAGGKDRKQLLDFLDRYARTMPRVTLRYAMENLTKKEKEYYMSLKR